MEVTFAPALSKRAEEALQRKKVRDEFGETEWGQYNLKRLEKKREKKERRKGAAPGQEEGEEGDEEGSRGGDDVAAEVEDAPFDMPEASDGW
jgi:hypothetical protein